MAHAFTISKWIFLKCPKSIVLGDYICHPSNIVYALNLLSKCHFIDCAKINFCPWSINLKLIRPKLIWFPIEFSKPKAMTHYFKVPLIK